MVFPISADIGGNHMQLLHRSNCQVWSPWKTDKTKPLLAVRRHRHNRSLCSSVSAARRVLSRSLLLHSCFSLLSSESECLEAGENSMGFMLAERSHIALHRMIATDGSYSNWNVQSWRSYVVNQHTLYACLLKCFMLCRGWVSVAAI